MKAKAGIVLRDCAECAVLLFGGNGYTKSGQGELVERRFLLHQPLLLLTLLDTLSFERRSRQPIAQLLLLLRMLTVLLEIYRDVIAARIPGGSEDVLFDLVADSTSLNSGSRNSLGH